MVAVAVNCLLPLAAIENVAGATAMDTTVAAVTVKVAAGDVTPPKVAAIAEVPAVTPVARPVCNPTSATPGVPEAQLAEAVTSWGGPKLMVAVAVNCLLPLAAIENVAGATAIDCTVGKIGTPDNVELPDMTAAMAGLRSVLTFVAACIAPIAEARAVPGVAAIYCEIVAKAREYAFCASVALAGTLRASTGMVLTISATPKLVCTVAMADWMLTPLSPPAAALAI